MNRAVIAKRAAKSARTSTRRTTGRPSTNLLARTQTEVHAGAVIRRTKAVRMTAVQRNSEGRPSEWNRSPYYFTDAKWSATVSG